MLRGGDKRAQLGDVRVSCSHYAPTSPSETIEGPIQILCTVEVEKKEPFWRIESTSIGGCYVEWCWVSGARVYVHTWRVRVGILGLREVQALTLSDRGTVVTGKGCWYRYSYTCYYYPSYYYPSSSQRSPPSPSGAPSRPPSSSGGSSSSSSGGGSTSSSSRQPAAYRFLPADW